jgi:hypothetical protein
MRSKLAIGLSCRRGVRGLPRRSRYDQLWWPGLPSPYGQPFCVTATEVRCSEDVPENFRLYRVFDSGTGPRVYRLYGPLTASCRLEPIQFRAAINPDQTVTEQDG